MKLLIVDDDQKIRDFLQKSLQAECYAVDIAENGAAGEALAKINEYDLIILDNLMPEKNGLDVCADLRAAGHTTPILILSVTTETNMKVLALNSGADDYLTKPFSFNELLARVRALLRRQPEFVSDIITNRDITIDTVKHVVTVNDTPVTLTRKEFMLLTYFMQNSGVVLSRGSILEHVWDMNADPFSNTIESHVLSLRKKLDPTDKNRFIKTVSGMGYKFE